MNEKVVKLGDALMALTTAEALELQQYLESKGLKVVQPAAVVTESVTEKETEESANVNVILKDKGTLTAIKLVKPFMEYTGKNAMETKKHLDILPATILENVPREVGKAAIANLTNELGTEVILELQDC